MIQGISVPLRLVAGLVAALLLLSAGPAPLAEAPSNPPGPSDRPGPSQPPAATDRPSSSSPPAPTQPSAPSERDGPDYVLMPRSELAALPTSGPAWSYLVESAGSDWPDPNLRDQDSQTNTLALAAALVYARTGDPAMRTKARDAIVAVIPTFNDGRGGSGLGPARQITGWVLAADLIELSGADDATFRELLQQVLTSRIGSHDRWGGSLVACHEDSDNNWGAWCGASRIAAAIYLEDAAELGQGERVFRGFLGDRSAWSDFRGQDGKHGAISAAIRSWACDGSAAAYVPTNPGCSSAKGGAFPADIQRPHATFPTIRSVGRQYQSETTAGVVLQSELLYRNGYPDAWSAVDGALSRVAAFNHANGAWNLGTVQYHWPWLINARLETDYPTEPARFGRSFGFTDWLYGAGP